MSSEAIMPNDHWWSSIQNQVHHGLCIVFYVMSNFLVLTSSLHAFLLTGNSEQFEVPFNWSILMSKPMVWHPQVSFLWNVIDMFSSYLLLTNNSYRGSIPRLDVDIFVLGKYFAGAKGTALSSGPMKYVPVPDEQFPCFTEQFLVCIEAIREKLKIRIFREWSSSDESGKFNHW